MAQCWRWRHTMQLFATERNSPAEAVQAAQVLAEAWFRTELTEQKTSVNKWLLWMYMYIYVYVFYATIGYGYYENRVQQIETSTLWWTNSLQWKDPPCY